MFSHKYILLVTYPNDLICDIRSVIVLKIKLHDESQQAVTLKPTTIPVRIRVEVSGLMYKVASGKLGS